VLVEIADANLLDSVNGFVHDCNFDENKVTLDENTAELSIEYEYEDFERLKSRLLLFIEKMDVPLRKHILKISQVEEYKFLEGDEGPDDLSMFNYLTYDAANHTLRIITVFGRHIEVKVRRFGLSIEDTHVALGQKRYYSVLGVEIGAGTKYVSEYPES
jgi:hypothetical protein